MIRRYALWLGKGTLAALLVLALQMVSGPVSLQAQRPELPVLTLTGLGTGWNQNYYPDGRIWVPRRGNNGERYFLMPVFIRNCWRTTANYEAFPIYSFKFKLQFDSTAVEYVGVEKFGPRRTAPFNGFVTALAKDFEFSDHVARDVTYQSVIDAPLENRNRGKRVMITATSSRPLPETAPLGSPCDQREFQELIWVKFRVIANPASNPVSARTPIILTNDTLFYNDFQVGKELTFPDDPLPSKYAGLGGVDNYFVDQNNIEQNRDAPRYSRLGMIWLEVTDEVPKLSFTNVADRRFRLVDSVDNSNGADWFVVNPVTVDSGNPFNDDVNGISTRDIDVINAVPGSRATDITVESDQPWLFFKTFTRGGGAGEENPLPQRVRQGVIPFIDKNILGTVLGVTPQGDNTVLRRDLALRIICDGDRLPRTANGDRLLEESGIYTGYITFKSSSIAISPVRLKVTFIVFRRPFEPNTFEDAPSNSWETGIGTEDAPKNAIVLEVRNSNNPIERTYLAMGVGARATNNADLIFGEGVYETPLAANSFGARWYPMDANGQDIYRDGLSDLWETIQSRALARVLVKGSSRDIRDIYSDTTLVFKCRFSAGSPLNYPIVVTWDTAEFVPGSELFIRDTVNGSRFNVNMRQATVVSGSRFSYTIQDADINAFIIEYTLPKAATFPSISKGWNLLSLPVNPSNARARSVFPNATTTPLAFAQNTYEQQEVLRPGIGYFVRFDQAERRAISGARLNLIDNTKFPVRLYDGWNTIGSLSKPISTEEVSLIAINTVPQIDGDIYKYVTDRGYQAVSEIEPGFGYWIRIRGTGYLKMQVGKGGVNFASVRTAVTSSATEVSVADKAARNAKLYVAERGPVESMNIFELPPTPPAGIFDVRFGNNAYVESATNPLIRLQGVDFPVTVTVSNPEHTYTVTNAASGEILGTIYAGTTGSVVINDESAIAVRLNQAEALNAGVNVSPNPVSASSIVGYTVAEQGMVTVAVVNMVGEVVATLVNDVKTPGVYAVDMNASNLPSGQYMVKFVCNNTVATTGVTVVR